jgi:hypothetical protein
MYRSGSYRPADDGAITTKDYYGYISFKKGDLVMKAHRAAFYVMGEDPQNKFVDHINGVITDNRWSNLRLVNARGNCLNMKKHRAGHLPGTTWNKQKGKWISQASYNGVKAYLGQFDSQAEAHKAYVEYCGENQL